MREWITPIEERERKKGEKPLIIITTTNSFKLQVRVVFWGSWLVLWSYLVSMYLLVSLCSFVSASKYNDNSLHK
jgi:hypothetical protein